MCARGRCPSIHRKEQKMTTEEGATTSNNNNLDLHANSNNNGGEASDPRTRAGSRSIGEVSPSGDAIDRYKLKLTTTFAGDVPASSEFVSPATRKANSSGVYSDRFIPSRAASNLRGLPLLDAVSPAGTSEKQMEREDTAAAYSAMLRSELLGESPTAQASPIGSAMSPSSASPSGIYTQAAHSRSPVGDAGRSPALRNLFRFRGPASGSGPPSTSPFSLSPVGADGHLGVSLSSPRRSPRKVARSPFKVLDAPALQDDFYLNLVDWSSHNVLAVGLGSCVYLWSACTSKVTKLCDLSPTDTVCSVSWTPRGTFLAVGTNLGEVQLWDAVKCRKVHTMPGHRTRVGTLAWSNQLLSSGSRDRTILQRDIRMQNTEVQKLVGHKSEVCGLKWSYDDRELASGGNDNLLYIWSPHSTSPILRCSDHTAAVKAISWSPHQQGLLASGGGTADRCIRFWNTVTNTPLGCVDTGSQVCNLVWSKNVNEIVSTHGYSQNQIIVWRYPNMSKLATLTGHTLRVLYLAISPDGQTIVTGAGDETLRFWCVFPGPKSQVANEGGVGALGRAHIR